MAEENKVQSSRPVIKREFTFRSLQAERVYRRNFSVAQAHMYSMLIMNRVHQRNRLAERASDAIEEYFGDVDKEINNEIARYMIMCEEYDVTPNDTTYTNPIKKEVEITLPQGNRLMNLIMKLDELMVIIDTLWWGGAMDEKHNITQARLWEEKVAKVTSRIRNMYQHIRKALQIDNSDQELTQHFRPIEVEDSNKKDEPSTDDSDALVVLKTGTD